jgi:hypothetical protein
MTIGVEQGGTPARLKDQDDEGLRPTLVAKGATFLGYQEESRSTFCTPFASRR